MTVVFEDRGKQYKVQKDDVILIEKIDKGVDEALEFDKVLLLTDEKDIQIGKPYLANAKVTAKVVKDIRDDKIIVFKFKRRTNYKRTRGHKQTYTMIKIESISA